MRSSRLLCYRGRVPPPPLFFTVWGFVNFGAACCRSRRYLADDLQTPSLRRPKWVLLIQSRPKWVLIVLQTTCRGPTDAKPEVDRSGSCSSRVDPSGSCSSCRRPAGDLQTPSLGRPKWVLLVLRRPKRVLRRPNGVLRRPKGALRRPKGALRRPKGVLIVQSRPQWVLRRPKGVLRRPKGVLRRPKGVLVAQSSTLLSLVRLGDGLWTHLSVPRTTHFARGVLLPPSRGVGSLAIRLTRTHRSRIANNGTTNRTKRIIFVLPRWIFF